MKSNTKGVRGQGRRLTDAERLQILNIIGGPNLTIKNNITLQWAVIFISNSLSLCTELSLFIDEFNLFSLHTGRT